MFINNKVKATIHGNVLPKQNELLFDGINLSQNGVNIEGHPEVVETKSTNRGILLRFKTGESVFFNYRDLITSAVDMIKSSLVNDDNVESTAIQGKHKDVMSDIKLGELAKYLMPDVRVKPDEK